MHILDLFCGTKCVSKCAEKLGHSTFSVDIEPRFEPSKVYDLLNDLDKELIEQIYKADIIFMSPPCNTFSMACGNRYWNADHTPKNETAVNAQKLLYRCLHIAMFCENNKNCENNNKKYYVIENPRARARWFLPENNRQTVWYCQYGIDRAKPTDIWTNIPFTAKGCKNNSPTCHHKKAPRGSTTGTQGRDILEKYSIPEMLLSELIQNAEKDRKKYM